MQLHVIAITGKARSGKDSAAAALVASEGFTRIALADALREQFAGLNGPTWELTKDLDSAEISHRRALQLFGTESREAIGQPLLWVHVWLAKVAYLHRFHPVPRSRFVVPDVRYPYEADTIQAAVEDWGGRYEMWKIERPDLREIAENRHLSERCFDQIHAHCTIFNHGTLDELRRIVTCSAKQMLAAQREAETEEELFDAAERANREPIATIDPISREAQWEHDWPRHRWDTETLQAEFRERLTGDDERAVRVLA